MKHTESELEKSSRLLPRNYVTDPRSLMPTDVVGEELRQILPFLNAYHYPAFICSPISSSLRRGLSVEPSWHNAAFHTLFGSDEKFVESIGSGEALVAYGTWLELEDEVPTTFLATFSYEETDETNRDSKFQLELIKTKLITKNGISFTICTSVARGPLPLPQHIVKARKKQRKNHQSLKIYDLPTFTSASKSVSDASSESKAWRTTRLHGPGGPSLAQMVETYPWEKTPLGPKDQWDPTLKQACSLTLASPYPAAIWWGEDLVLIYNDAYADMSTTKHPHIFAQRGYDAWQELWDNLGPALAHCLAGNPVYKRDDLLLMDRLGVDQPPEETYHTWSWTPILNIEGKFGGVFNTTHETTTKVIAERRMSTTHTLGNRAAVARTTSAYCAAVLGSLEENDKDIPFAALYLCDVARIAPTSSDDTPLQVGPALMKINLRLEGTIGVPEGCTSIPASGELLIDPFVAHSTSPSGSTGSFSWPFTQAILAKEAVYVELPDEISNRFIRRGWGDRPSRAVVVPLSSEAETTPLGVVILGLNTRTLYGAEYSKWIDITRFSLSALLTAVIAREEEIQRSDNLAELDAAKTALFSNASHELRTPLTLISGPIQDCLDELGDSKLKAKLQLASRNVDRLSRLVESLMDFSRLEAGRLEGRYVPKLFGPFVEELAELFRGPVEKAQLTYKIEYDHQETRALFLDTDYMEKIIFNLISNAFKYTMKGGVTVKVEYSTDTVSLIVRDTGVGIPKADIVKIWERFHRVEATSRSHEGTGIGLALTKQLIKLHGGRITVVSVTEKESKNGEHGSEFTATFPLGKDHLPATQLLGVEPNLTTKKKSYARGIVAEAARWRVIGDSSSPSDDSYGSSEVPISRDFNFQESDLVLLVDDNQDMLDYIRNIFARYCQVKVASDGQQGLEMARTHLPQLVISDVMMPGLDGFGLIGAMKENAILKSIPIILLTARADDGKNAEAILSGADDYLAKPFSSRELLARASLQIQLGKRKQEMETRFQERTKEIQILSDLSPAGLFRIDTDRKLALCNGRFYEISGLKAGSENDWLSLVHPDYQEAVQLTLTTALEKKESAQVDFVFSNGNWVKGHVRWWPLGLVGTVTDMSMTRLYEESLKNRAEEAEERRLEAEERRRGQELLVDVTSHELRQPVSAVINCASVVFGNLTKIRESLHRYLDQGVPFEITNDLLSQVDEDLESLNAIELCGLAQGHIVNDILTLSRMQLHMLTLQDSVFPLAREIRQVCSIMFNEMKSKDISHTLEFSNSFNTLAIKYVTADKVRFGQVIINLLSNAIRFSQSSLRRSINISVDVSRSAPSEDNCLKPADLADDLIPIGVEERIPIFVYISVHDSGPGLKPKDLELLFQRFQKGSNSEEVFGGSGLGLFVSRKICDLLGGRIEVDANSVGDMGSTFRFYVRMITAKPPLSLPPPPPRLTDAEAPAAPLRVLIAEDNQVNRTILSRQLKANNCVPQIAINGAEAIDLVVNAGDNTFDCILMDCEMPVMSGLDATRELRRLEASGVIPPQRIIALTGNAREQQIEMAIAAGMDEVMTKPYRLTELLERIRSAFH